jgi:hypothetical protein
LPGQGDHPGVTVDAGDFGAAFGEPAGEHPVAAADIESLTARRRDRSEEKRLVVDVVVPVVDPIHQASRVGRIPLAACAH